MAFDVYVGTMTRFYRRDWENIVQRRAREQGMRYQMIYAGGEPAPPPSADEIRQAVANWCQALSAGLQPHGYGPLTWDESDGRPYFTDRPAWEGYSALLIWAAHAEHSELPLPAEASNSWADDEAYQRSTVKEFKSRFRTILEPQLWLPVEFPFVFGAATIISDETTCVGSTFMLKQQLDQLHTETSDMLARLKTARPAAMPEQPPVAKPGLLGRLFGPKPTAPQQRKTPPANQAKPSLAEMADLGLGIFRGLATKACEHRLPILLHF